MNKVVASFLEMSLAVFIFIAALSYGLSMTTQTQQSIQLLRVANQVKDKNIDLQLGLHSDRSIYGSDVLGILLTEQRQITNITIDRKLITLPIKDKEDMDLSFIKLQSRYNMHIMRGQDGHISEIKFEQE